MHVLDWPLLYIDQWSWFLFPYDHTIKCFYGLSWYISQVDFFVLTYYFPKRLYFIDSYFIVIPVKILRLVCLRHFCSSFGQSLQTSNYPLEICFAIFISLFGLLLFLCFLENLKVNSFFSLLFFCLKRFEIVVVVVWCCRLLAELGGGTIHLWLCEDFRP